MPHILHNSPTRLIIKLRLNNPAVEPLIITQWPSPYLVSGHGKLRATGGCNNLGERHCCPIPTSITEEHTPNFGKRLFLGSSRIGSLEGLYFSRAARPVVATEIGVSVLSNEIRLQHSDSANIAMVRKLSMPGMWVSAAVGVEEDDYRWKKVIIRDNILKVNVCFLAFVLRDGERGFGVIDCVDCVFPAYQGQLQCDIE